MAAKPKLPLPGPSATAAEQTPGRLTVFSFLFGAFLGLILLKFGNPPIFEKWVATPEGFYEFLLGFPWPISWAYALGIGVLIFGAINARSVRGIPNWVLCLPGVWLLWVFVATIQSVDSSLSEPTLKHLAICVICFYIGLFSLSRARKLSWFWLPMLVAFSLVIASGFDQHFGGLEQTRRYFFLYIYATMKEVSPEYLKKMSSTRIFSTLFYPNALAGVLLLFSPAFIAIIGESKRLTQGARYFLMGPIGMGALACLYWSGSKGGWLLAVLLGVIALLRAGIPVKVKYALLVGLVLVSLTGFCLKYAGFFKKGATSVSARFDYWRAAVDTTFSNPVCGTGPGTFAIPYGKIKRRDAEMSRLVHNDYLEQASDSGIVGFLVYVAMIASFLYYSYPRRVNSDPLWVPFSIWLGLMGFCFQGLMEFGLYIPALAWNAFAMFGLLLGWAAKRNCSTKNVQPNTVRANEDSLP